jgi:hypothetical protein
MSTAVNKYKNIQIVSNPCIRNEGREKIEDVRKFLEAIELPEDSSNHYLFIDGNGAITLCVSDTEINSPLHAKYQTSIDLFSSNVERKIVQCLTDFWQRSIETEKRRLQAAQECYLQFSALVK